MIELDAFTEIGVGLDLNFTRSGVCVARGNDIIHCRVVTAKNPRQMGEHIKHVLDEIMPAYVGIEGTYLGKNAKTFEGLAELRGNVLGWCDEHGVYTYVGKVPPIDEACNIPHGLKSPERKTHTRDFARLLGFDVAQDAADALCVVYWALHERKRDRILQHSAQENLDELLR